MVSNIVAIAGVVSVVVSLLFTGWQTRELTRQTRINNSVNIASAYVHSANMISAAHNPIIADPELRAYFYEGVPCPDGNPDRPRVITIAELLADGAEYGLMMGVHLKEAKGWRNYPTTLLANSPMFREVVALRASWWPNLHGLLLATYPTATTGEPSPSNIATPSSTRHSGTAATTT